MKKLFYQNQTGAMLKALLRRDWLKLIAWVFSVLLFAASGAGKFEVLLNSPSQQATVFTMFQNPAMTGLFGPTSVTNPEKYNLSAAFGQTMTLLTAMIFSIVSIIYVINRTRLEEDDGITELFRSFPVGKLAATTALVIELFVLQVVISISLAASLQLQGLAGMTDFNHNLLYAAGIGGQGLMWGAIALVFAQIFPDSGSAKGASFGFFGLLYLLRMGTDSKALNASWFNPISWSYLTDVYVKNNWLPILLTMLFTGLMLALAYFLEFKRDVGAGYLPEFSGKKQASKSLLSLPGLVFHQQKKALIGWILGLFVLGVTYGSMISQIGQLVSDKNSSIGKILAIDPTAGVKAMTESYLSTIVMVIAILTTCFGISSLSRMVSEERKGRQEQIYSLPISRAKVYFTYTVLSWIAVFVAQVFTIAGLYLAQMSNTNALSLMKMMEISLVWLPAIFFVLGLLALLIAVLPRLSTLIWIYIAFTFFMSYLGNLLELPKTLQQLNIYYYIPKLPIERMDWTSVITILLLSVLLNLVGFVAYKKRDLSIG